MLCRGIHACAVDVVVRRGLEIAGKYVEKRTVRYGKQLGEITDGNFLCDIGLYIGGDLFGVSALYRKSVQYKYVTMLADIRTGKSAFDSLFGRIFIIELMLIALLIGGQNSAGLLSGLSCALQSEGHPLLYFLCIDCGGKG